MYCVGLTGNIASGKSTVADIFKQLNIDVISADQISKTLTKANQPAFYDIVAHFGHSIVRDDGELDRVKLRHLIFENTNERQWLESILHPLIRKEIEHRVTHSTSPYAVIEIPLLTDKKHYPYLNRILLIVTDAEEQLKRLISRDNCSRKQAIAILSAQPDNEKRRKLADDIVVNNDDLTALNKRVTELHENYLNYSEQVR